MSDAGLVLIFCFLDRLLFSIMNTEHYYQLAETKINKTQKVFSSQMKVFIGNENDVFLQCKQC